MSRSRIENPDSSHEQRHQRLFHGCDPVGSHAWGHHDRAVFEPIRTAVELIAGFRRENPATYAWRQPPYEYEHDKWPIDILYGSDRLRRGIDAGETAASIAADWPRDEEAFRELRQKYLLY